jgi:hypothetical protein
MEYLSVASPDRRSRVKSRESSSSQDRVSYLFDVLKKAPAHGKTVRVDKQEFLSNIISDQVSPRTQEINDRFKEIISETRASF